MHKPEKAVGDAFKAAELDPYDRDYANLKKVFLDILNK